MPTKFSQSLKSVTVVLVHIMSVPIRKELSKSYICSECNLTSLPLLVCPSLHKICGKCYDLFCNSTIICPTCGLEFTSIEEVPHEIETPISTEKQVKAIDLNSSSLIDDLLNDLPEPPYTSVFSNGRENENLNVPFYKNWYTYAKSKFVGTTSLPQITYHAAVDPKAENCHRQIRRQCFLALWDTATLAFGSSARKSKRGSSTVQVFCSFIINSFVRKMGRPIFMILENHNTSQRANTHALYIGVGGGLFVVLFLLKYCVKPTKR